MEGPSSKTKKIEEIQLRYHLKIIESNCLGIIRPKIGFNTENRGIIRNDSFGKESNMGDIKNHRREFFELSKRIFALGESIRRAEKDLKFQWVDKIEQRDLRV
jgi:hypothetical protein